MDRTKFNYRVCLGWCIGICLVGLCAFAIMCGIGYWQNTEPVKERKIIAMSISEKINILIPVLIQLESGGDCNAVGDGGKAVGILQIHPIMVNDVNRICENKPYEGMCISYRLMDRWNREKSIEMCYFYLLHYGRDEHTFSDLARMWNGGPTGHTKECTKEYGERAERLIGLIP